LVRQEPSAIVPHELLGDGHTAQGRGNACIDETVDAFYLKGTLPAKELRCTE
jgi:hypothetical protein